LVKIVQKQDISNEDPRDFMIYRSYWCINENVFSVRYEAEENVHGLYVTNEHD